MFERAIPELEYLTAYPDLWSAPDIGSVQTTFHILNMLGAKSEGKLFAQIVILS